ncbi:MAG: signal peptidase II [Propionibacteriaceae bacterium]|nr:signal peptidase II [Propionibacteriaceae bacterium]
MIAIIAVLAFLADLGAKELALAFLDPAKPIDLLGGLFSLRLLRNPGAAFSLGENMTVVFAVFAAVALTFVTVWLIPKVRVWSWAVIAGLLWAGIAGNLADRLFREPSPFYGEVVDFISVPYFAVFNVADIWISCSAVLIVYFIAIRQQGVNGATLREPPAVPTDQVRQP